MTDITFITSNQIKLAHARFICKDFDVRILQYKKYFYGVSYEEPRIFDRDQLLSDSFNDALRRWAKNVSNYENKLFFIEDTSVRIDALSDGDNEVPGVDVKYWMKENSFDDIDQKLKNKGNNRKVCVSSHIVLFLTDELRKKLKTDNRFKVFSSTSTGTIVEKEFSFETQILYPWLDNQTFNKWFVPDGASSPISTLSIEQANKGDFRRGAFLQMLSFLRENGAIKTTQHNSFELRLQFDNIFLISGPTCSGKSSIGKYLAEKYGYYHIEASDFMSLRYFETHGTKFIIDKNLFAKEVLKTDPLYVVNQILDFILQHNIYDRFIITGFRSKDEILGFLHSFPSRNVNVIYLNASIDSRFDRWVKRKRETDNYTFERFKEINNVQKDMGITEIKELDFITQFDNNRNGLSLYFKTFENTYQIQKFEIKKYNLSKIFMLNKLSLEKTILITLAIEYQKNDSNYFTTTEISRMINNYFKHLGKNKNNVSRYFNQSFYLYYEIKKEGKKNKYKLSPIGYSEALIIMRNLS